MIRTLSILDVPQALELSLAAGWNQTMRDWQRVLLLEPEGSDKEGSVVVENKFGSVVIDKPGYGTEIPDEKSPPSPVRRMQLRTIDNET